MQAFRPITFSEMQKKRTVNSVLLWTCLCNYRRLFSTSNSSRFPLPASSSVPPVRFPLACKDCVWKRNGTRDRTNKACRNPFWNNVSIVPSHDTDLLLKKQRFFSGKSSEKAHQENELSKMFPERDKTLEFILKTARQYAINQAVSRGKWPLLPKKESSLIHSAWLKASHNFLHYLIHRFRV